MADITYCSNTLCPFKDCERHFKHAPRHGIVSLAALYTICRRYITWLAKMAREEIEQ